MLNKPKFKSCFHIEIIESVGAFLLSESDYFVLKGHLYELLAPLIDGHHSVDEIVDLLREKASTAEIYYALMLMEQKGYLVEADDSLPLGIAAFWDTLNVEGVDASSRLQTTKVTVTACGDVPTQPLISALTSLNIQVTDDADVGVVVTDDYLRVDLDELNCKAIKSQRPWILVKPVGTIIWIGPIFEPGKTGCWQCLAQRLRANRPVETFIQNHKNTSTPCPYSLSVLPPTLQIGLNLAATEIAKWIVQGNNKSLKDNLVTFDLLSLQTQNHRLVKRPQCPVCGERKYKGHRRPAPVILTSQKKAFTSDGGHRCVSPQKTLQQYEHHISHLTGAVRGLSQIATLKSDLTPTYVAGHNFATIFDSLYFLRENLRGRSGGKGKTTDQAKASALCEAIERYSGVFQGDEIRQLGRYLEMEDVAIHPNACMNFSKHQYQTRQQWNASCPSFFQKVPEPFAPEQEIDWTPVWSLTHQKFKYLPTAYCYYGYRKLPQPYCWADSNGTAAGNTREEAILQGFMELVERDSVAIWWYNRIQRPAVNLASFDEPYFQALKDYYKTIDRQLWVLDITSDLNIPTFAAISRRIDRAEEDIIYGFGAHFDPKIAITRALTEVNQVLPAVLATGSDGKTEYRFSDPLAREWWNIATCQNQPYLVPDAKVPLKTAADYPHQESDDLLEEVMTCVDIAAQQGLETLVLDQTRPDIGLNVVKVIIPGLRHFWKRLAPGRLYEVPVKLGWLAEPLQEEQLNPFPIFF